MILMICAPIRATYNDSIRQLNKYKELSEQLQKEGHKVLETDFIPLSYKNADDLYQLAEIVDAIGKVDGLVFMPDWEDDKVCKIEHYIAKEYEKFIKEVK